MEETRGAQTIDERDEISLLNLAVVCAENLWILIAIPLIAGLIALGYSSTIPPTFTATTKILSPQIQQGLAVALATQLGALAGPAGAAAGIKNPADTYVAMLRSRTIADRLIERFGLKAVYGVAITEYARRGLASRTQITSGRDGLIGISVDDHDPQRAADLANGYVEEMFRLTQTLAVTEAGQRRVFFERQLEQTKDDLTRAQIALQGAGISESILNTVPESAIEFVATLKAKVTAQEIKLAALRGFMTEENPELRQAQLELGALRAQLTKAEQNDGVAVKGRGAEYVSRVRDFKYHGTLFELMAKQYELARLDEAREGAVIQVVDVALPPELKSKPVRSRIAVRTTLAALVLVLIAIFARRALRNAAADPQRAAQVARLRQLLLLRKR